MAWCSKTDVIRSEHFSRRVLGTIFGQFWRSRWDTVRTRRRSVTHPKLSVKDQELRAATRFERRAGLVVKQDGDVVVLEQRVRREDAVVGLDNRGGDLEIDDGNGCQTTIVTGSGRA